MFYIILHVRTIFNNDAEVIYIYAHVNVKFKFERDIGLLVNF